MTMQRTIFTDDVMRQVRLMLAVGKSGVEIARSLNCNPDSLRAACKRSGILLRASHPKEITGAISIRLTPEVSDHLRAEAKRRGIPSSLLAAEIIDTIVTDGLYSAVLDK